MFDALSPQRRRLALGAASMALLLIMAVAVITVIRVVDDSTQPVSQASRPGPLVPGYGGNVQSLEPLAARLRSAGRTAVIVEPVGDGTGDLRAQAEHLGEVATSVRKDSGAASVDVVGYSAGGVVARLWARRRRRRHGPPGAHARLATARDEPGRARR